MAKIDNLPLGFHFRATIEGVSNEEIDIRFQEVSGLTVDIETEDVVEGGENRFVHKLPTRTKYSDLTLKRVITFGSQLNQWLIDTVQNHNFRPADIVISLLNEKHEPLATWRIVNAFPLQWAVSDFNAENNAIVIETIKLNYDYFTVENNKI